jgi:toxin-antitoxin system PIN domain toxin
MIIPDANLLIYAHNEAAKDHERAKAWWQDSLAKPEIVGLSWLVLIAFVRVSTNRKAFKEPISVQEATDLVDSWLALPRVQMLQPGHSHAEILFGYLNELGTGGNITSDAHLAALAVEHQATIYTADSDFARFSGLRWKNPLK